MYHVKRPSLMSSVSLREPLRTPPRITKQVQQSGYVGQGVVERYTEPSCPLPSEGPVPFIVRHANGEHSECLTYDCRQCGREVAAILKGKLQVGQTGRLGVCVRVRARAVCVRVRVRLCVCVCVCVRERETERQRQRR